ncbi:DUF4398 domain-containing protein [Gracilinema caldarium]|uniref:DUF4398 domain-containing protein n=1 Tax=Gracilinema caldarium (strain ATCC 51460 / DSM 7334 / H1) TaxID=744872 RepID=F8F4D9_GRAC1|nr:DUF4398 domain-containing protein [Gracilinema caldarium]AEJ20586.1 hypothetical protein Spica_2481 [Gracilinema caldarium DSM 7334]
MKRNSMYLTGIALVSLVVLFSCAKPPTAEMDAATAAVAKAQSDPNVTLYAPESLKRATDSLTKMKAEADAKRYDTAKALAQETIKLADQAIADGSTGLERAKDEAAGLIASCKSLVLEVTNTLNGAKKVARVKLNVTDITKQFNNAKATLASAEKDQGDGNFKGAIDKGKSARTTLSDILSTISGAVQAASKKK